MVHQLPDIKAVMGREVRVLCPASGYPLENILWSKGEFTDSKALKGQEVGVLCLASSTSQRTSFGPKVSSRTARL